MYKLKITDSALSAPYISEYELDTIEECESAIEALQELAEFYNDDSTITCEIIKL